MSKMREFKKIVGIILAFVICFSLCACGGSDNNSADTSVNSAKDSDNNFVGTWTYSRVDGNENSFEYELVLNSDGTYSEVTYKNGKLINPREGEYKVEDNSVVLRLSGDVTKTYTYEDGNLCNMDTKYTKK